MNILAAGAASIADTGVLGNDPEFRKATMPMMLAYTALDRALKELPTEVRDTVADWGLVVGVNHGELEVTKEFLCTLATRGIARPFLFQAALHNATLGFLSLKLGMRGPGATVGTCNFAGEDALDLALDWLRSGDCEACVCVGVEAIDRDMEPVVQTLYDKGATPGSNGAAVILCTEDFRHRHRLSASLKLKAPERQQGGYEVAGPILGYHGADAVRHVAEAARRGAPAVLILQKPDGCSSRIVLGSDV